MDLDAIAARVFFGVAMFFWVIIINEWRGKSVLKQSLSQQKGKLKTKSNDPVDNLQKKGQNK
jgi:hypothetical protein